MRHLPLALVAVSVLVLPAWAPAQQFSHTDYQFMDEPEPGEVDIRAELHFGEGWPPDAVARIVFCYDNDANHLFLQVAESGLMLGEMRNAHMEPLATRSRWPDALRPGVHEIIIKRRAWSISVLCNQRTVLRAYEEFAPGEQIGFAARGVQVRDLHTQPIGEMVFHDRFQRLPDEADPWEAVSGTWELRLPDARLQAADPVRAANPFSYVATGSEALTLTGPSFWDGYHYSTATKPVGDGAVGLAFYVQDEKNHYLFRVGAVTGEGGGARAELVRVVDGEPTILTHSPHRLRSEHWAELAVRAHDGRLEGLVDGEVVCRVRDDTFGEGRIGLYMQGCERAHFDDVALEPYRRFEDSYAADGDMPVQQLAGTWTIQQNRLWARPDADSKMAIGLTGCAQWRDYCLEADVIPGNATSVGVYFGHTSPSDFYLFRWGPQQGSPRQERQELWKVADGDATLLDARPAALNRNATYRVTATMDRAYLAVAVDGRRVVEAVDPAGEGAGRIGYYAEGWPQTAAAFDNMRVSFCDPPVEPVTIAEQFAKEDTMADWARPLASWQALGNRVYAYALPVWGDFNLRIHLRHLVRRTGSVALRLAADKDALVEADDSLVVASDRDDPDLRCEAPGAGSENDGAVGAARPETEDPLLELERRGGCVVARLDGNAFAWARVPDGAQAPVVGIKLDGMGVNLNNAVLTSPAIIDTAFSDAPTDWRPQTGIWAISDRWSCQPQWSWFSGRDAETPLIWSKQAFSGDMVFEFWAAVMMETREGGGSGYSRPSDLNGIIAGDGKNLSSGYAFVFAGDNNTRSKILRRGETVAETTAFKFENPTSGNRRFHNQWFHLRVERTGSLLTYYIDGRKALEYDDPSPLSGGHVGFWTHQGNGIMIARTRIAFQE